ncbi:DinB family protein [Chitinophaga silvatica]|uniref:DinB family protein n=1 Tax=Chitinophaga silvatica TaxID=2282649 RepID=A0A3E1YHQ9_9BACT|nr:DinB family protein [Chitinophaga silvatica]RFS26929.1 DinB family protein [Chitinophaga silvatica]
MENSIQPSIERLDWLLKNIPSKFAAIEPTAWELKPQPSKWSKKEILGHLIDSAANNHQRFVRIQFEETPTIRYQQNDWNKLSNHQLQDAEVLVNAWLHYNTFLKGIIQQIPVTALSREGIGGEGIPFTLAYIIQDYVSHMEHHLRQIMEY